MNIEELKEKLPEGIWLLSGGNLGLQKFLKNNYSGKELDDKLKECMEAMKLELVGNDLWVILIHTEKNIWVSKISQEYTAFNLEGNNSITLLMDLDHLSTIDGNTIEEIKANISETGIITREEYEKYKNRANWDKLPKAEFEILPYWPD